MIVKKLEIPFTTIFFRYNRRNLFLFWNGKMKGGISRDPITEQDLSWYEQLGLKPPTVFLGWHLTYRPKARR